MRVILIALIILVAAGAGFAVLQMSRPEPQVNTVVEEEPKVEAVNILVAREPISIGTIIAEDMVDQQPWPKHLVLNGFIVSGAENSNVIGFVARSDFQAQEPLNSFKLADPNDANFIAASLPEGTRALTLAVDMISGVAGFLFVGDRVDIIMTHRIPNELAKGAGVDAPMNVPAGFAETVLSNIKILAVNGRGTVQQEGGGPPSNITVEVTLEQAQQIRLAEANGSLSLVLRPLKREESAASVTTIKDLTGANVAAKDGRDEVFVVRGVQASGILSTISTGK